MLISSSKVLAKLDFKFTISGYIKLKNKEEARYRVYFD